jgi:hypothetical protein
MVVAQQAKTLAQLWRLIVPHAQRGTQGVRHDEHGRILWTFEDMV